MRCRGHFHEARREIERSIFCFVTRVAKLSAVHLQAEQIHCHSFILIIIEYLNVLHVYELSILCCVTLLLEFIKWFAVLYLSVTLIHFACLRCLLIPAFPFGFILSYLCSNYITRYYCKHVTHFIIR